MAAKRETPRQKMIGMMYLVLTALLALQVSSALIYKFQALNTSLEKTVASISRDNQMKREAITTQVKNRGSKPQEVEIEKKANEVRKKTIEMLAYIEHVKNELISITGGKDEDGGFKGAKEETDVEVLMIGANEAAGEAYQLKEKLDSYCKYMNTFSETPFDGLAKNANEDPSLKNNGDQKNKDYAHLNFGQTPLVAALAILSETSSKIVNMENKVLTEMLDGLGIKDYKFDKLKPMVKPKSDFVVAGTKYEAEMFMVATSTSLKPGMKMGESNLPVNEDGVGTLSFLASGGNYGPDNTLKKVWKGLINMKKPDGGDTTYAVEQEYTVVKPVIQIQSGSIQSLYRNCGNKLQINVPALGSTYNPTFSAEGAKVIRGSKIGAITLVPTSAQSILHVKNNGMDIGQENFGVKLIPLPTVDVKVNNRKIKAIEGIPAKEVRSVSIRILPEKYFQEALPDDAKYFVTEATVYLARGRKIVNKVDASSYAININPLIPDMQVGDRLIVEVKRIKRKNYNNEFEEVSFPEYNEIIMLN